jgi:hypothetical protein
MDLSAANSREYQRQAIDAEIKSLEESIRALKRRRNALAPISSLPTEVTILIFSFLRTTSSAFTPGKKSDPLAWLRVAHVYRQWREIALNEPLFWSHVDFTNLSSVGAAEILVRAKTAPLYLEARVLDSNWDNARFSAFQEGLRACVSRICHLHISADDSQLLKTLEGLISPAPTLERLSLSRGGEWIFLTLAVPESLFGGNTPRLSCLKLLHCDISWKSPLLRGLRCLDIRSPTANGVPSHSVWLDALDEMPQLKMLTLYGASPRADWFPFDVERTVTLPSLTHFDIADSPYDCAFALAHLNLPALTCLNVTTFSCLSDGYDVREVLPYITQHAHGSQDTHPLQSVLIRGKKTRADILAWPVPNIDVEVHGSTSLAATAPARVALSFWNKDSDWNRFDYHNEILSMAMAAVPLDGLVTLITQDFLAPPFEQFWLPTLPRLPLLRRVRLTSIVATKFIDWLQADKGAREDPLLPSLKELVFVDTYLYEDWTLRLCEVLMKRVEQGVPLEMLDLRTCRPDPGYSAAIRILSEIVVDVVGPEETVDARAQIISMWDRLARGSIVGYDDSGEESQLDTDDDDDSDTSSDGEDEEEE